MGAATWALSQGFCHMGGDCRRSAVCRMRSTLEGGYFWSSFRLTVKSPARRRSRMHTHHGAADPQEHRLHAPQGTPGAHQRHTRGTPRGDVRSRIHIIMEQQIRRSIACTHPRAHQEHTRGTQEAHQEARQVPDSHHHGAADLQEHGLARRAAPGHARGTPKAHHHRPAYPGGASPARRAAPGHTRGTPGARQRHNRCTAGTCNSPRHSRGAPEETLIRLCFQVTLLYCKVQYCTVLHCTVLSCAVLTSQRAACSAGHGCGSPAAYHGPIGAPEDGVQNAQDLGNPNSWVSSRVIQRNA